MYHGPSSVVCLCVCLAIIVCSRTEKRSVYVFVCDCSVCSVSAEPSECKESRAEPSRAKQRREKTEMCGGTSSLYSVTEISWRRHSTYIWCHWNFNDKKCLLRLLGLINSYHLILGLVREHRFGLTPAPIYPCSGNWPVSRYPTVSAIGENSTHFKLNKTQLK